MYVFVPYNAKFVVGTDDVESYTASLLYDNVEINSNTLKP